MRITFFLLVSLFCLPILTAQTSTFSFSENQYQWLGAYVKFTSGDKYTFRFSFGDNLNDNPLYSRGYYKLSVFIPLYV